MTDPLACVLAPLVALPALVLMPRRRPAWASGAAAAGLGFQVFVLVLAAIDTGWMAQGAALASASPQAWLPIAGVTVDLRLDGVNLVPAMMAPILGAAALITSWQDGGEHGRERAAVLLVTVAAAVGVLCAFDLVVLCLAFQVAALGAAYLLGAETAPAGRRAAVRFATCHLAAATVLLGLVLRMQVWLDGPAVVSLAGSTGADIPMSAQSVLLAAAVLCFATPLALVPIHGWLSPCAAAGGRIGVLLVVGLWHLLGAYGLCRVGLGMFPQAVAVWAGHGAALATLAALYGALAATAQSDLRQLLAWVFISLSALVFLAMCTGTAEGVTGALVLATAQAPVRLVLMALALRPGSDGMGQGEGSTAGLWLVAGLALVALPGSGAFAGAVLAGVAIAGLWPVHGLLVLVALGLGTAALLAPCVRRRGGLSGARSRLDPRLRLVAAAALALTLAAGLWPGPLVNLIRPAVGIAIGAPALSPGPSVGGP